MYFETPDSEQSIPSLLVPLKEIDSHAKWSTALLASNPFFILTRYTHSIHLQDSPLGLCYSLKPQSTPQIQGTTTQNPSSLILTLLNMHPHSKARIPQILIIPQHQPFIRTFTKLLGQVVGTANFFLIPSQVPFQKPTLHLSVSFSAYPPLFSFPSTNHHLNTLSSCRPCSFHLPSSI